MTIRSSDIPAGLLRRAGVKAPRVDRGPGRTVTKRYSCKWIFYVAPCPAPRQVRKDAWEPSPSVVRYREFKDEIRSAAESAGFTMPASGYHVTFYIRMPKSWSKRKRAAMDDQPHEPKPDRDNLEKSLLDALLPDSDSHVWNGETSKRWASLPRIEIECE